MTYARLRLPWWLFRLTGPDDRLVMDWCCVRWPEESWAPAEPVVVDLEHLCHPECLCIRERVVPGIRIG